MAMVFGQNFGSVLLSVSEFQLWENCINNILKRRASSVFYSTATYSYSISCTSSLISHFRYGGTESNCNLVNIDGKVGAVGFLPILFYKLLPMVLVRVDDQTGELIRNPKTGLCIRSEPGEIGELLGKIVSRNPMREFQGYLTKSLAGFYMLMRHPHVCNQQKESCSSRDKRPLTKRFVKIYL